MCLARGGVGGEWIGFWLYQSCGNRGSVTCLYFGFGGIGGEWVEGLHQGLEGWRYVCASCKSGLSV